MTSYVEAKRPSNPVVLRRRSANYPGQGKRIHGIVFDHPSMPKIMAVSSVPRQVIQNNPAQPQHVGRPQFAAQASPPALIHSPPQATVLTQGIRSAQNTFVDSSKQPSRRNSLAYHPARAENAPTYGVPSTSHSTARAIVSGGTPLDELSRLPAQLEKSRIRYPQSHQNCQRQSTSGPGEFDRHAHFEHKAKPSRLSGASSTTIIRSPSNTVQSYGKYFPTSQSELLKHATQASNTALYLEQRVSRRNSTGGIGQYPSNVVNKCAHYTAKCKDTYVREAPKDFARNFHYNVWRESSNKSTNRFDYPSRETAQTEHGKASSSFVSPPTFPSVSASEGPQTFISSGNRRSCECNSGRVHGEETPALNSHSSEEFQHKKVAPVPSSTRKKEAFPYRRLSETVENGTSCYRTYVVDTQELIGYTRESPGHERDQLCKSQNKTDRDKKRKESTPVVVISDSEDEEEMGPADWNDNASDVFPIVEVVSDERKGLAKTVSSKVVEPPIILLGGLASSKATVKNEELSKEEVTATKDCPQDSKREGTGRMGAIRYLSNCRNKNDESRKSSCPSVFLESDVLRDWGENETGVLIEQRFHAGEKYKTRRDQVINDEPISHVSAPRAIDENSFRCAAKIDHNALVKDGNFYSDGTFKGRNTNSKRASTDENNNVSCLSHKVDVKQEVDLDSVNSKINVSCNSERGVDVQLSEKASLNGERYPSRSPMCMSSDCYERSSVKGKGNFQLVKKEPRNVSEFSDLDSSRNGSSSPTYELGFLTRQLSKLTDDEMKSDVSKSEPGIGLAVGSNTPVGDTNQTKCQGGYLVKKTCGIEQIAGKLLLNASKDKTKFGSCEELHSRTCDSWRSEHECPASKTKLSDVTSLKSVTKPTGIVVGIKQARYDKEPLSPKVLDFKELAKDGGRRIQCNGTSEVLKSYGKTSSELGKGFGLLQFNVVEKNAGATWKDEADCSKNAEGSRGKVITSQQWEAFSMKLEKGATRRECACERPKVTSGQVFGKDLEKGKVYRQEFVGQNVLKDQREHNSGVTRSLDSLQCVVSSITNDDNTCQASDSNRRHLMHKYGIDKFSASETVEVKPTLVEVMLCQEDRSNVEKKRPNSCSDFSKNRVVVDMNSYSTRTYFSENGNRQKVTEGDSDGNGHVQKLVMNRSRDCCAAPGANKLCPDKPPSGICLNEQLTPNREARENVNDSQVILRSPRITTSHLTAGNDNDSVKVTANSETFIELSPKRNPGKFSTDEKRSVNGGKSPEAENPEKRKVLTAEEWKVILVGRIEQVRESLEIEQTPWKAKNKRKVLEKLEQQLKWWDDCPSVDDAAFISRRLQFFQTMRNQYELMKKIDAQRNTLKNTMKVTPERVTVEEEIPKAKVLKTVNTSSETKRTKIMKRSLPSSVKKGRLSLKKAKKC